eukprot:m.282678 g.282678  ORF g.282678 m.282678 type:complete len:100 (+) comp40660_c0_seq10:2093-2392(+)
MCFQVANTLQVNSVNNTVVFACFEANDSSPNLHIALDKYREQVREIKQKVWKEKQVVLFLCGDYEFLTRMYGLSGASGFYIVVFKISGVAGVGGKPKQK